MEKIEERKRRSQSMEDHSRSELSVMSYFVCVLDLLEGTLLEFVLCVIWTTNATKDLAKKKNLLTVSRKNIVSKGSVLNKNVPKTKPVKR
jgi:hypothetical protein